MNSQQTAVDSGSHLPPEVKSLLWAAADGASNAGSVSDDRWQLIEPMDLISSFDRELVPPTAEDCFPMTWQQRTMATRMLLSSAARRRGSETVPAYHNVAMSRLRVPTVDAAAFQAAGHFLVANHEVFRSCFDFDTFSSPMQVVFGEVSKPLVAVHDLRHLPEPQQESELSDFAQRENCRPIDLTNASLVRFTVHLLSDSAVTLTITEPHAIIDGWSTHLNLVDFLRSYTALASGKQPEPLDLSQQQFRLRHHSAQQMFQEATNTDEDWWRSYLDGIPDPLPRPADHSWRAVINIDPQTVRQLHRLAESSGTGLKSVLLAVHLHALASLKDDPGEVMTAVTGNTRLAVEGGVEARGMFLNVSPLRVKLATLDTAEVAKIHRINMGVAIRGRVPIARLAVLLGRRAVPDSLFVFNSFHSVRGAAHQMNIDTLEAVEDWSHTEFPFEASFNRSEETADYIRLFLFSESWNHQRDEVVTAYSKFLEHAALLGRETR